MQRRDFEQIESELSPSIDDSISLQNLGLFHGGISSSSSDSIELEQHKNETPL